jgi:preprotein translocase subunit SecD
MMRSIGRFNIYLAAALAVVMVAGCKSAKSKEKKDRTIVELHLEVPQDGTDRNEAVPIYRSNPSYVNVEKEPFLDTGNVEAARVVDEQNGLFHIELKFNWQGTLLLDGVTTDNHHRRIAVMATIGKESRWLGAPLIQRRMSDGIFTFTPDATREESDQIVRGLNNLHKELKDRDKW